MKSIQQSIEPCGTHHACYTAHSAGVSAHSFGTVGEHASSAHF